MTAQTPLAEERFTFFWQSRSPFSQWHKGPAFVVDGRKYVTAEQYMMVGKALLFGDDAIASRILATSSPREQKALGRKVKGFNDRLWRRHREAIVLEGNRAKFAAYPAGRAALLATAGTTLVEASPKDGIWGIGVSANDPAAARRDTWKGLNLLGHVLTRLRDEMLAAVPS